MECKEKQKKRRRANVCARLKPWLYGIISETAERNNVSVSSVVARAVEAWAEVQFPEQCARAKRRHQPDL